MATNKEKEFDYLNNEANLSIYADHLGLTPQFVKENKDKLKRIEDKIKKSLRDTNRDDPTTVFNTMKALQKLTEQTFPRDTYDTSLTGRQGRGDQVSSDGFRMIFGDNENKEDSEIFNFHANIFSNYRNLVSEYRNIARLIPEINRCADMKSRDILAINEITKKAITNVYIPETNNPEAKLSQNLVDEPINAEIEEKILEKYNIEDRLPRYIKTALIEGAKPVVVYPYKDVIEMAKYNITEYRKQYKDFNSKYDKASQSNEALIDLIQEYHKRSNSIVPKSSYNVFHVYGSEDVKQDEHSQYIDDRDKIINKYMSQEDFNEYYSKGLEDIEKNIDNAEKNHLKEIYGSNAIDKSSQLEESNAKFRDIHAKVKAVGALSEHFKNQIFNAVKTIDANIDFYDQNEAIMISSINNFRRLMQFTGYKEDPKAGIIAYGAQMKPVDRINKELTPIDNRYDDVLEGKKPKSVLDEFEEEFSGNSKSLLNDCLIKEYDAEDVIPVIVAGKHVGYYIIELSPYTGNVESINKRNCNFTDMFINLGIANDQALSPSPSSTGSFASGMQAMPLGGMGPASEISSVGISGVGSVAMAGGLDIAGFDVGPIGDDALRRNNIMKKIMFNVLSDKLKRRDIQDDETFVDTIMSLIRDGAIIRNKVKIIYVPEKYMCYFSPELDGNGIPQSFMKNCLFTCYEKILVNMNTIMTRLTRTGSRDKITVNIGKAKNMGYSIRSIENALSTRRLNVESPFTSLSRVLKAASLSETIIVPVFDGEQLFTYEDLTRTNEGGMRDDDLEQRLINDIVTSLKCPITITNPYQEEDFASMAASRNAEYRFDIIKQQKYFSLFIEKFIKLLIVGSGLYDTLKKSHGEFNLKNIKVVLTPPETLNMKNANDTFGVVDSYVNNIINIVINPDDSSETTNMQRFLFKQRLYTKFMPGINLDEYIKDSRDILNKARLDTITQKENDSVNSELVNTSFEPRVANRDGSVATAASRGTGNGDSDLATDGW